jgi:hypothetical protein
MKKQLHKNLKYLFLFACLMQQVHCMQEPATQSSSSWAARALSAVEWATGVKKNEHEEPTIREEPSPKHASAFERIRENISNHRYYLIAGCCLIVLCFTVVAVVAALTPSSSTTKEESSSTITASITIKEIFKNSVAYVLEKIDSSRAQYFDPTLLFHGNQSELATISSRAYSCDKNISFAALSQYAYGLAVQFFGDTPRAAGGGMVAVALGYANGILDFLNKGGVIRVDGPNDQCILHIIPNWLQKTTEAPLLSTTALRKEFYNYVAKINEICSHGRPFICATDSHTVEVTESISDRNTPSKSVTSSRTRSRMGTYTRSLSKTKTFSRIRSGTGTDSQSLSKTKTFSRTRSRMETYTSSHSSSKMFTRTRSGMGTYTKSLSKTKTFSRTRSRTGTYFKSSSITKTLKNSKTLSQSDNGSPTNTFSATYSNEQTQDSTSTQTLPETKTLPETNTKKRTEDAWQRETRTIRITPSKDIAKNIEEDNYIPGSTIQCYYQIIYAHPDWSHLQWNHFTPQELQQFDRPPSTLDFCLMTCGRDNYCGFLSSIFLYYGSYRNIFIAPSRNNQYVTCAKFDQALHNMYDFFREISNAIAQVYQKPPVTITCPPFFDSYYPYPPKGAVK